MTINVIKPGLKKEHWDVKYRSTCRRCKCVFTCNQSNGKYVPVNFRNEGDFVMIECPNCKYDCRAYPSVLDVGIV